MVWSLSRSTTLWTLEAVTSNDTSHWSQGWLICSEFTGQKSDFKRHSRCYFQVGSWEQSELFCFKSNLAFSKSLISAITETVSYFLRMIEMHVQSMERATKCTLCQSYVYWALHFFFIDWEKEKVDTARNYCNCTNERVSFTPSTHSLYWHQKTTQQHLSILPCLHTKCCDMWT